MPVPPKNTDRNVCVTPGGNALCHPRGSASRRVSKPRWIITDRSASSPYTFDSMDFLKGIAGKIVGGVVALLVIIAAVSWFTMNPADRQQILSDTGRVLRWIGTAIVWLLFVGAVPWAT